MRHKAIYELYPNAIRIGDIAGVFDSDGKQILVDESLIQAKIAELTAAEPMRQLRIQRNELLQQTDWRMTTDYPYADQTEWASYRVQLRDLPMHSSPTLDENGTLANVDWPTAPSEV